MSYTRATCEPHGVPTRRWARRKERISAPHSRAYDHHINTSGTINRKHETVSPRSDPDIVLVEGLRPAGFALIGWADGKLHRAFMRETMPKS
jgi:hypothetical protein